MNSFEMLPSRRHVFALAAAAAAAAAGMPRIARADSPTIRMGQNAVETFAEGYYAGDRGFFKDAGLDVEILTFPNGAAQAAACLGGTIDVGLGEATEIANGIARGLPFGVFAGGSLYDSAAPTTALCVAPDGGVATAKDFEGKAIAVPVLTSLSSTAVKAWLVSHGAQLDKVHFVEIPLNAMSAAVARGTVAGAHIGEPFLSAAADSIRQIAAPYDAIAKQFLISDWFATRAWIEANTTTVKRLVGAIYRTARWTNENHDASAPILAKYTKIDVGVIRKMRRIAFSTALEPRLVQPVLDAAFTFGGLPRRFAASELIVPVAG